MESIFTRISDSEQAFNGSGDPSIAVDYGFIIFFWGGGGGLGGGILVFAFNKIFLPGFGLRIHHFFFSWRLGGGGGGILDFACHKIFLPGFRFGNKILTEDLGDKS